MCIFVSFIHFIQPGLCRCSASVTRCTRPPHKYQKEMRLCCEPLSSPVQMEHRHRKKETPAAASTHHLFVHMKSLTSANLGEELEVFFHIYDGRENRPLR